MNQIMPIGKGVVIAIETQIPQEAMSRLGDLWRERMPDVPAVFLSECQIVLRKGTTLFEFTGDVSPTMVAEFQRWWTEVNGG